MLGFKRNGSDFAEKNEDKKLKLKNNPSADDKEQKIANEADGETAAEDEGKNVFEVAAKNENEAEYAIEINDLHKSYGTKKVLMGLNLKVKAGELFGFIGKNGIGKSTTIDCMIGSKKFDKGEIYLDGYDIKTQPLDAKFTFGYVASEPSCYDVMTGYDYLEFVASIYRVSEGDFVRNYRYLAKRLKLDINELNNRISNYSHGMKQKLCLIASLIYNPDLWILDEPTVGLDIMAVEELKKMMREYANHGKTVFVTSHNIDLVAKICDRVAIINNGQVAALYDLNKEPNRRIQLARIFMQIYGEL